MLQAPSLSNVFGVITDFLTTNPTPEQIITYRLPSELEARAHDLLERNREAQLSPDEIEAITDKP